MRDLYCSKCSEPTENDYLHDIADEQNRTYSEVLRDFQVRGCEALGDSHGQGSANPYADALYDLMGDDVDGVINMMEDYPEFF
jgi:hypothetical protein